MDVQSGCDVSAVVVREHAGNSLDLLRLIAAWMVLFSHQFALLGQGEPSFLGLNTFGGAGVAIFFFLSGNLVWTSWLRDPHWGRYFARRALRIFPALWVVVALSVFVLGPMVTRLSVAEYFSSHETWRYLLNGLLMIKKGLAGVFEANPLSQAVNGSLWTLPSEFLSYIFVALWGLLVWLRSVHRVSLALLVAVSLSSFWWMRYGKAKAELEVMAFFWWGAAYGQWRWMRSAGQSFDRWALLGLVLAFGVFAFTSGRGLERAGLMLVAAVLVHGAMHSDWASGLGRSLGDLSYGVYIYAFPVQQTWVHVWPEASLAVHLVLSTLTTLVLAYVSWHAVEKVALRWKPQRAAA